MPEIDEAMTGLPAAIASMSDIGMPSICPSVATMLGRTKTSLRPISSATSCCGSAPRRRTESAMPFSAIHCSVTSRSGPSPTMRHSTLSPALMRRAQASTR
jgi:hypothetical protein